ncbi:MAG: class I SAM-dependent methyltransferase [Gammaproteobacteria bacterium]|nr:class I SAM-dependent methyltransferase [Gammaproteobacteria bacterium]
MNTTYRKQFVNKKKATAYDQVEYGSDSYNEILWRVEQEQLAALIAEFRRDYDHIDYLDFAAGTGRIVGFLEDKVDNATAVEISSSMVELARKKLTNATVICADITANAAVVEQKYDLITAFRFVLNAEPDLRLRAMRALAARLRDSSSWLVFNNHGNLWSHKLLLWPLHRLRRLGRGYLTAGNYMTNRQARKLADQAGLRIERVIGAGVLSAKVAGRMSVDSAVTLESRLARSELLSRLAVNQMYVARLK